MRLAVFLLCLFCSFSGTANNSVLNSLLAPNKQEFLPVDQAFRLDFTQTADILAIRFAIEPDYYLYKHKLEFVGKNVTVHTAAELPQGEMIEDEFFGVTEVYFNKLNINLGLADVGDNASVKIRYQGCAKAGLCYPPEIIEIPVDSYQTSVHYTVDRELPTSQQDNNGSAGDVEEKNLSFSERLATQSLMTNLALFFAVGVGLAFTPCVFPMFPILSSLIAGQKNLSTKKAFSLSFVYVQGMAVTYAILGLVVAYFGGHIQGYLQHPYVLISFSLLFVLLALSMFGLYEIRLPQSMMNRLTAVSNQQQGGSYLGVFFMGVLSGLIASPCTTAPLSAALLYVAQSGDFVVGGLTLYALSLGMGLPLLLLGTSGGKLLPKAGGWMEQVKTLFGFLMLFVPLILLERILPFDVILLMAGILAALTAIYLHFWQSGLSQSKGKTTLWTLAMVLFVGGFLLVQGYFSTPSSQPTNNSSQAKVTSSEPTQAKPHSDDSHDMFIQVANLTELKELVADTDGLVMVDLYADWCVACKEFEKYTFPKEQVQAEFEHYTLVQIDLTESDDDTIEVMEEYSIFGLPSILFFNSANEELPQYRVAGFLNADEFAAHLNKVRQNVQ